MSSEPVYLRPDEMPDETKATYEAAEVLNGRLSAVLQGSSFEVAANAIVNLLIAQAVHGGKQTRDDMRAVLTHAIEYINRLDMQAPSGAAIN